MDTILYAGLYANARASRRKNGILYFYSYDKLIGFQIDKYSFQNADKVRRDDGRVSATTSKHKKMMAGYIYRKGNIFTHALPGNQFKAALAYFENKNANTIIRYLTRHRNNAPKVTFPHVLDYLVENNSPYLQILKSFFHAIQVELEVLNEI